MPPKGSSATQFAILGMLSLEPMSGYDIRRFADESIGYFWTESYGQIYPTLKLLEQQGLAGKHTERTDGKPDRQVYSITPKGREALVKWLAQPARQEPKRNELLLKLFFAMYAGPGVAAAHLSALLERDRGLLHRYNAVKAQIAKELRSHPGLPYWIMSVDFGIQMTNARVRWAEESLRVVRGLAEKDEPRARKQRAVSKSARNGEHSHRDAAR